MKTRHLFKCQSHDNSQAEVWHGYNYVGVAVDMKSMFGDKYAYVWLTRKDAIRMAEKLLKHAMAMTEPTMVDNPGTKVED